MDFNSLVTAVANKQPQLKKLLQSEASKKEIKIDGDLIDTNETNLGNLITAKGKTTLVDLMHRADFNKEPDATDITKDIHSVFDGLTQKLSIFFDEIFTNPSLYGATRKPKSGIGDGLLVQLQTDDGYKIDIDEAQTPSLTAATLTSPEYMTYGFDNLRYGNPKQVTSLYEGSNELRRGETIAKVDQNNQAKLILKGSPLEHSDKDIELLV